MMLQDISPNAELISKQHALQVNTSAAIGLMNVLKSNLGPVGTLKLLVGGAGQLKLTKDGLTLLKEMQIQHPTAALIARTATAQDEVTGDGTTSTVLLVGSLLREASTIIISEGIHPRIITDGYDIARDATIKFLHEQFINNNNNNQNNNNILLKDRELLMATARSSLITKLDTDLVETMSTAVVDTIQTIAVTSTSTSSGATTTTNTSGEVEKEEEDINNNNKHGEEEIISLKEPIDLHRVEIITLQRKLALDSRLVRGLVLDHGGRHPDMPTLLRNVHIMTCNISLEYEQAETSSQFVYTTAEQREKLVESERAWLDERCRKIVTFKRRVCKKDDETFCIINQKGVDPLSLDIFAKEGILCLRRAKRRNMERLVLACGGRPILSLEDLDEDNLGYAGQVSQVSYGEEKYTFVEDCPSDKTKSCTMLLQGPNQLTIDQIKDSIRDGLRAVKNAIEDRTLCPGAGSFELAASIHLHEKVLPTMKGKVRLGIQAYAAALLVIPKTLIVNAGYDVQDVLLEWKDEYQSINNDNNEEKEDDDDTTATNKNNDIIPVGFDYKTGQTMLPMDVGVWDNVRVKRQSLHLSTILANQLLLVDEIMRAGKQMGGGNTSNQQE